MPQLWAIACITAVFSSRRHRIVTISFSACTLMPQKASVSSGSGHGLPVSGFYAPVSHRIVRHESCAIGQPLFPSVRDAVLAFAVQKNISLYDEQTRKGILHITLSAAFTCESVLTDAEFTARLDAFLADLDHLSDLLKRR